MADANLVERIMATIRGHESGGNYQALNKSESPDKAASGAYQMIGSTWRGWAAQSGIPEAMQYSRAVDAPPEVQDAVARWSVGHMLDANGGNRDAVWASWYTGGYDPSNLDYVPSEFDAKGNRINTVTVRTYINQANAMMDGGTYTASSEGTQAASTNPDDQLSADPEVQAFLHAINDDPDLGVKVKFPSWSMYLSDPELGPILRDAATQKWDDTRLLTAVQATNWWRTTSDANRAWDQLVNADPAAATRQRQEKALELSQQFSAIGYTPDRAELMRLVEDSLRGGWDANRITQSIVAALPEKYSADAVRAGDVSGTMADLKASASKYYMPLTDDTAYDWSKRIAAGTMTDQGVKSQMLSWAKSNYAYYAPQLDEGQTLEDLFRPLQEQVATIMGTGPGSVDLMNDSYWRQLTGVTDATGARRAPTIQDAETLARDHPNWQYTADAHNRTAGIANDLISIFTGG